MQERALGTIGEAAVYGLGSGVGWFLAIVAIAAIQKNPLQACSPTWSRNYLHNYRFDGCAFMSFMGIKL